MSIEYSATGSDPAFLSSVSNLYDPTKPPPPPGYNATYIYPAAFDVDRTGKVALVATGGAPDQLSRSAYGYNLAGNTYSASSYPANQTYTGSAAALYPAGASYSTTAYVNAPAAPVVSSYSGYNGGVAPVYVREAAGPSSSAAGSYYGNGIVPTSYSAYAAPAGGITYTTEGVPAASTYPVTAAGYTGVVEAPSGYGQEMSAAYARDLSPFGGAVAAYPPPMLQYDAPATPLTGYVPQNYAAYGGTIYVNPPNVNPPNGSYVPYQSYYPEPIYNQTQAYPPNDTVPTFVSPNVYYPEYGLAPVLPPMAPMTPGGPGYPGYPGYPDGSFVPPYQPSFVAPLPNPAEPPKSGGVTQPPTEANPPTGKLRNPAGKPTKKKCGCM
eukprot:Filipodium_phascolosomae@DN7290_c0_g1_i1.p1